MVESDQIFGRLNHAARAWTPLLAVRPRVAGLIVYGSLSAPERADLTPFSDVDIAVVLDGELPVYFAEHRLWDGIKLDLLFFSLSTVQFLAAHPPESLYRWGWLHQFLIGTLLRGAAETVLYDPLGEIARCKEAIQRAVTYEDLVIPTASEWVYNAADQSIAPAQRALAAGDPSAAVEHASHAAQRLSGAACLLGGTKNTGKAAERLGIPAFHILDQEISMLTSAAPEDAAAVGSAARALWDYGVERAYLPVLEDLSGAGHVEPHKLELIGDYPLFWPGYRLNELGRVIHEVYTSLDWSQWDIARGNYPGALGRLWRCQDSASQRALWNGIDSALLGMGSQLSSRIQPVLADSTFAGLGEELDRTSEAAHPAPVTLPTAALAVEQAEEMQGLLAGAFPLLSRLAVGAMPRGGRPE